MKENKQPIYFIADTHDGTIVRIENLPAEMPEQMATAILNTYEVVDFYVLVTIVTQNLEKIENWIETTPIMTGNYLLRQLLEAELLCRDFLFSFRTCLDHLETSIKRKHGDDSQIWKMFKQQTGDVYDNCPEYGFTYHLRNCSQHCASIVHGFGERDNRKILSEKQLLQQNFKNWNEYDKLFLAQQGDQLDIIEIFNKANNVLCNALKPVMQEIIDQNSVKRDLWFLRDWGEALSKEFSHDVRDFHVFSAWTKEREPVDMAGEVPDDTTLEGNVVDWDAIYGITDMLRRR